MNTRIEWPSLLQEGAHRWHNLDLAPDSAAASAAVYADWSALLSATAPELPFDATPADFVATLAAAADLAPFDDAEQESIAPSDAQPWLEQDLVQVAEGLRRGAVSAEALARQSLQRLRALDRRLNACVCIDDEAALERARACDSARQQGLVLGPLHGVPLAHKDLLYRAAVPVGCGLRPRVQTPWTGQNDAAVLTLMARAGMVDVGRLHMTELAFDPTGCNSELGPCRNPWDPARVPGGSSSGSAVAVAARAVFAAIGSDTGGSIRIPAGLCGVTGLKPTHGLVSTAGAMPLSTSNDNLGPLARTAADCALMMQVLVPSTGSANAPEDRVSAAFAHVAQGARAELRGLRIGVPDRFFREGLDDSVGRALDASLDEWCALGASVHAVPDLDWAGLNARGAMLTRAEASARLARVTHVPGLDPALRARFQEGLAIPASAYVQILSERALWLSRFLDTVMHDVDVLHLPVCRIETPFIDEVLAVGDTARMARHELTVLNRPFNYLGVPVLSLPGGQSESDDRPPMPVGFQLVGRPYADARLLAIGASWQRLTRWHRLAPPV